MFHLPPQIQCRDLGRHFNQGDKIRRLSRELATIKRRVISQRSEQLQIIETLEATCENNWQPKASTPLEVLYGSFVSFGCSACLKRAQIPPLARGRVLFARI
jgi:hypothetical protein